jgi:hypothetical protein
MATTGINVQNIGMSYGKDWQNLNEEGLADTLGYGAKRKQDIKNKLIGGAIEYAGNMFKPVPPPEAQAPVPSGGLGSNLGQSLNQFPNKIAPQPAPNAEVQQINDAPEDVDKFVKDIVPKQVGSFTGALDEIGGADALASMGDAASMFAFV